MVNHIKSVKKRDGRIVEFQPDNIREAIYKAITATGQGDGILSKKLTRKVTDILKRRFNKDEIPNVEQIQDVIEEVLIMENLTETAKAFILYREKRRMVRDAVLATDEAVDKVDQYLGK